MSSIKIEKSASGIVFTAKIVPGSSKTAIVGELDGQLKIKVSAAPEKGKANKCLIEYISKKLAVKKKDIQIISGMTNAVKQLEITGINEGEFLEKLQLDQ